MFVEHSGSRLLVFVRESEDQRLLVIHNMSQVEQVFTENIAGDNLLYGNDFLSVVDEDTMRIDALSTLIFEVTEEGIVISEE